jgi:hypothetical protein
MAVTTKKTKLEVSENTTYSSEDKVAQAFAVRAKASKSEASSSRHGAAASEVREPSTSATSSRFSFSLGTARRSRKSAHGQSQAPDRGARAPDQEGPDAGGGSDPVKVQVAGTGRTVRARMWLTKDSPINQKQLLPLLDIVGSTNQYITKVCLPAFATSVGTSFAQDGGNVPGK